MRKQFNELQFNFIETKKQFAKNEAELHQKTLEYQNFIEMHEQYVKENPKKGNNKITSRIVQNIQKSEEDVGSFAQNMKMAEMKNRITELTRTVTQQEFKITQQASVIQEVILERNQLERQIQDASKHSEII